MTAKIDLFAAAPASLKTWLSASQALNAGLEPTLVKLVEVRASQLNGCAHCINMHTIEARAAGEREQRLAGARRRSTPIENVRRLPGPMP